MIVSDSAPKDIVSTPKWFQSPQKDFKVVCRRWEWEGVDTTVETNEHPSAYHIYHYLSIYLPIYLIVIHFPSIISCAHELANSLIRQ